MGRYVLPLLYAAIISWTLVAGISTLPGSYVKLRAALPTADRDSEGFVGLNGEALWRAPVGSRARWDAHDWVRTVRVDAVQVHVVYASQDYIHELAKFDRPGYIMLGVRAVLVRIDSDNPDEHLYSCTILVEFNAPASVLRHETAHCFGWIHPDGGSGGE